MAIVAVAGSGLARWDSTARVPINPGFMIDFPLLTIRVVALIAFVALMLSGCIDGTGLLGGKVATGWAFELNTVVAGTSRGFDGAIIFDL